MKKLFFILGLLGISVNYYFLAMIQQPLFNAVHNNDIPTLEELINKGYDVLERDDEKRTPLHLAVIQNNLPAMRLLLKVTNPNVQDIHYNTPLFYAILYDRNSAILHHLVDAGANVNMQGDKGYHPLHAALYKEGANQKIISFLLARGAKSGKPSENCDPHYFLNHESPWDLAARINNTDAIRLMQESHTLLSNLNNELLKQAGEEATPEKIISVCDLLDQGAQVNTRDKKGQTPLKKALDISKDKYPGVIELLLYYGARHKETTWSKLISPVKLIQDMLKKAK